MLGRIFALDRKVFLREKIFPTALFSIVVSGFLLIDFVCWILRATCKNQESICRIRLYQT